MLLRLQGAPDDAAVLAELNAWKARSDRHIRAWMAARSVWSITGQLGADHPVFRAPPAPRRRMRMPGAVYRRPILGGATAVAAAACLAVVAGPSVSLALRADYRTGVGEVRIVSLPDGSTVQLDSASAIAVTHDGGRRGVRLLAGRAFFSVAKDRSRPFQVAANEVTVTVTGTQFDVGMTDRAIDVDLAEGSVRADYGVSHIALRPGDHFRYDRGNASGSIDHMSMTSIGAWRRGKLLTEGATIEDVVDQIRPYYSGRIILTDSRFARRRVTGAFDLSDPVAALRNVVDPHHGRVRRVTPWLVFVSAK